MIKKHAKKIIPEELQDIAMKAGTSWHHHCVPPKCFVNDTKEDIVVLETSNETYYSASSKDLREDLEEHSYQLNKLKGKKAQPSKHESLGLVRLYSKSKDKWHFHIAMPSCILSMATDFTLIVENDSSGDKCEWSFAGIPTDLVREIDDYYLGRKK